MIKLTDTDTQNINNCLQILRSRYSYFDAIYRMDNAMRIAAVRMYLGMLDTSGDADNQIKPDFYITLSKLCHLFPEDVKRFYVSWDVQGVLTAYPILAKIYTHYQRDNFGSWNNMEREIVILALHNARTRYCPYVIEQNSLMLLIRSATEQAEQAKVLQQSDTARSRIEDMMDSSLEDRRPAKTVCYRCGSTKSRRIPCIVCGYIPTR